MDRELSEELLELQDEDRRVRERLATDGSLFDGYNAEMEQVHRRNAARLRELVADHGWPDRALVTDDAAGAAWTILQHSIGEPEFMRRGLELVKESAARGHTPAVEVAMLEDRIATYEGRPQRYGTQWDWDEQGLLSPLPLAEPERVDEHRAAVGLPPLDVERARRRAEQTNELVFPATLQKRRREAEAWARSVGWCD